MHYFRMSFIVTLICVAIAVTKGFMTGGMAAALSAALVVLMLGVMEVSLSFDNAVVNAKVLETMTPTWQHRFLTWGMLVAVFGMRALFPLAIVAVVAGMGIPAVLSMALNNPTEYAHHLHSSHTMIAGFGGAFLLMVFLDWAFDGDKDHHWLGPVESFMARAGNLQRFEILVALALLALVAKLLGAAGMTFLVAGLFGLATYLGVKSLTGLFGESGEATMDGVKRAGFASFMYLEILDASFSFDGVIGAFAVTRDVVIITAGLAIGAMFVRSLTIWLVDTKKLAEFRYLEHGAHWGIGVLALIMFASTFREIPEVVTGVLSVTFIGASLVSSIKHNIDEKRKAASRAAYDAELAGL